ACSRSPASAALVMEFPRIIPAIGITYCGSHHGVGRTTTPMTYASVAAVEIVSAAAAIQYTPGMGLARRETAAWVATAAITTRITRTQYQRAALKTAARIRPTR